MKRREPPSLATWMLEHLTPGDRDEALAGDLLEEFRRGRSDDWYWHQVLTACAVTWLRSLRAHLSLIAFALLWSMPAPAWALFCDRILDYRIFVHSWQVLRGFWVLPALAVWTALHSTLLWAGIVVYLFFHVRVGAALRTEKVRRAFWLAPLLFLPVIGATFVLMNLYSFPGLVHERLAATALGQIGDVRMPADVLRIPYVIAMLCALWGVVPRTVRKEAGTAVAGGALESDAPRDTLAVFAALDPFQLKRFFGFMVGAGLMNAMIGAFLLCRLPESNAPSLASVVLRAFAYVVVAVLAGVLGTWLYWRNPSSPFRRGAPLPFALFALVCAAGWVWVPAMAILSEQISPGTAVVAMIGALVLASGLRTATYPVFAPASQGLSTYEVRDTELFAESLYRPPFVFHGYVIAIALYAAGAALLSRSIYTAASLLALSGFLFAWHRTVPRAWALLNGIAMRRAAARLVRMALAAVLVTAWALLYGVAHRQSGVRGSASAAAGDGSVKAARQSSQFGPGGYESVILWPYPEKKQIVAPLARHDSLLAPGAAKPLVIRFDGPYWYLQPPDVRPGSRAHQAHGTPVNVDIKSSNSFPLIMSAHQSLSAPIRLSRCREIQVDLENRDNRPGFIAVALLLTDGETGQKSALYLGQQPIVSSEAAHFSIKQAPLAETLRFPVPLHGSIAKFDKITVMALPDVEHEYVSPKIAIEDFRLLPR